MVGEGNSGFSGGIKSALTLHVDNVTNVLLDVKGCLDMMKGVIITN